MAQQNTGYGSYAPSFGYAQDTYYQQSSAFAHPPPQPPPIPDSSFAYSGYGSSYGQEQLPVPKYQPMGSYGAIGEPVKLTGVNPKADYDAGQFASPPRDTSWPAYDNYGGSTGQYGTGGGTFERPRGYNSFLSGNNDSQADGLTRGFSTYRGRPPTRGVRGRGRSQQGFGEFDGTDGYNRGAPGSGIRGQYDATTGTGRGQYDGGRGRGENVGRGGRNRGKGQFDSRSREHFDGGSSGRGQFDGGSRGRGHRGRGQFDAARGRGKFNDGNIGSGQYDSSNRGRGRFDGGNMGRGQFGGIRGRGQSDAGYRGRGQSYSGNRGRGQFDGGNRGRGQFDGGNRGRGSSRGRGRGQEGSQGVGQGGTWGQGQDGFRGRGARDQGQTGTRGRGLNGTSNQGQRGGTRGRGQQDGTRGRGQTDTGRAQGRGTTTFQPGIRTPKPFKMSTDASQGFISYKNYLQEYCQKNHQPVPQYTTQKADIGYTASVTVEGMTYSCLQSQREKKDAEQGAAFEALKAMSFIDANETFTPKLGTGKAKKRPTEETHSSGPAIKIPKQDEPIAPQQQSYKSKLNESCQKMQCDLPSYSTIRTAGGFLSTVVLNGQVYQGLKVYGTKKLAEQHVAEIVFNQLDFKTGTSSVEGQVSLENLGKDV